MKRYKVTILNRGHIPGIGHGPFRLPLIISEEKYNNLVKLGYRVNIVDDLLDKAKNVAVNKKSLIVKNEEPIVAKSSSLPKEILNKTKKEEVKPKEEEVVVETIVEEPPVEIVVEKEEVPEEVSTTEETVEEEVVVDDPDLSAGAFYTQGFLTSKNICRKILNARMVQYEENASFVVLKKLVKESNPDVVVEE